MNNRKSKPKPKPKPKPEATKYYSNDRYYIVDDDRINQLSSPFLFQSNFSNITEVTRTSISDINSNFSLHDMDKYLNSPTYNQHKLSDGCLTDRPIRRTDSSISLHGKRKSNKTDKLDLLIRDLKPLSVNDNYENFSSLIYKSSKSNSGFSSFQALNQELDDYISNEKCLEAASQSGSVKTNDATSQTKICSKLVDKAITTDANEQEVSQEDIPFSSNCTKPLLKLWSSTQLEDIKKLTDDSNYSYDLLENHIDSLSQLISNNTMDDLFDKKTYHDPNYLVKYIQHIQVRTKSLYHQINKVVNEKLPNIQYYNINQLVSDMSSIKCTQSTRSYKSEKSQSLTRQRPSLCELLNTNKSNRFHFRTLSDSQKSNKSLNNLLLNNNMLKPFKAPPIQSVEFYTKTLQEKKHYYRLFEVKKYDDIIKSYKSQTDRRFKSLKLKVSCKIDVVGPFKVFDSTELCWNTRDKIAYRILVSGETKNIVDMGIKSIHECFPFSCLQEKVTSFGDVPS